MLVVRNSLAFTPWMTPAICAEDENASIAADPVATTSVSNLHSPTRTMLTKQTCFPISWRQLGVLGLVSLALGLPQLTQAATTTFKNQCNYTISVHDNEDTCDLSAGSASSPTFGCERTISQSAVYRHGTSAEATLAEFAYGDGKVWYDLSTIPPGATGCESYSDCVQATGKSGFNVGVMIEPDYLGDTSIYACSSLMCQYASCPDAFRFPTDSSKVRNCPESQHFNVIFCP